MNIRDLNTKEKLEEWGNKFLLLTGADGITPSAVTNFPRAIVLLDFITNLRNKTITLVLGVYELDLDGNPIISQSLMPYEQTLIAHNGILVDQQGQVVIDPENPEDYIGEFDFFIHLTKNNPIQLWDIFSNIIVNSSVINPK